MYINKKDKHEEVLQQKKQIIDEVCSREDTDALLVSAMERIRKLENAAAAKMREEYQ